MNRPRLSKGLRIAWTVGWGIVCLLLVLLWVRSQSHCDIAAFGSATGPGYVLESVGGSVSAFYLPLAGRYVPKGWDAITQSPDERVAARWKLGDYGRFGFTSIPSFLYIVVAPHWLPAIGAATAAATPWIRLRNRFSIRTLLIGITLIAVVLCVVVWSIR